MTDDIIRIDGVEYEWTHMSEASRSYGWRHITIRPKRKQTGWICHGCHKTAPCVMMFGDPGPHASPRGRPLCIDCSKTSCEWHPFYGKVVE